MTSEDAAVLAAFDPWTADDDTVDIAQAAFERGAMPGPGPRHQAMLAREVLSLEPKVRAGVDVAVAPGSPGGGTIRSRPDAEWDTGAATLRALMVCASAGLLAPEWLLLAATLRFEAGVRSKDGWSDPASFGRPHPKGTRVELEPRRERQRAMLYYLVQRFRALHPGEPDARLWEHFSGGRKTKHTIALHPHLLGHIQDLRLTSSDARARFAEAEAAFGILAKQAGVGGARW